MNWKELLEQYRSFRSRRTICEMTSDISSSTEYHLCNLYTSLNQSNMESKNTVVIKPLPGADPAATPPWEQMKEENKIKQGNLLTSLTRSPAKGEKKKYMREFSSNLPLKQTWISGFFPHEAEL